MRKKCCKSILIALFIVLIVGIHGQTLSAQTFDPAPSDINAYDVMEKLLEVNRPWLEPNPILASYRLIKDSQVTIGEYELDGESGPVRRVGVILNTPLHEINRIFKQPEVDENILLTVLGYSARSLVIEAKFLTSAENRIGFYMNNMESYSFSVFPIYNCRIYLNPDTYTPTLMQTTSEAGFVEPYSIYETWNFKARYFESDDGIMPSNITLTTYEIVVDLLFQFTDDVWMFYEGASWYNENNPSGMTGLIDSFQIMDLVVTNPNLNSSSSAENWNLY